MKKINKITLATLSCFIVFQFVFSYLTVYDTNPEKFSKGKDAPEFEHPAATLTKSKTDKYILRYNPETAGVMVITQKTDGSEIHTEVDEVNTFFLTDEDIKNLTEGIEVDTKEELFMLIEDFSS